jgi:hypothetical protein
MGEGWNGREKNHRRGWVCIREIVVGLANGFGEGKGTFREEGLRTGDEMREKREEKSMGRNGWKGGGELWKGKVREVLGRDKGPEKYLSPYF